MNGELAGPEPLNNKLILAKAYNIEPLRRCSHGGYDCEMSGAGKPYPWALLHISRPRYAADVAASRSIVSLIHISFLSVVVGMNVMALKRSYSSAHVGSG